MPDRLIVGGNPKEGMVFHYRRARENWVITIVSLLPNGQVSWCWKKDISRLDQIDRAESWRDSLSESLDEWKKWLLDLDTRWGDTYVELLTPEFKTQPQPEWEV
jgi:hypothetical protein